MLNPDRGDRDLETVYDRDWLKANQIELFSKRQLEVKICKLAPIRTIETLLG